MLFQLLNDANDEFKHLRRLTPLEVIENPNREIDPSDFHNKKNKYISCRHEGNKFKAFEIYRKDLVQKLALKDSTPIMED